MANSEPTLWEYVAPADRETLVAGTLAWLLDPRGTHGLGDRFVAGLYEIIDVDLPGLEHLRVLPEAREGRNRRFDILLDPDGEGESVVLEVKTKTSGSARQLRKYAESADHVFRVGFEEWNYFELDESARDAFPLLKLSTLGGLIEEAAEGQSVRQGVFLRSFVEHLEREYSLLRGVREYFVRETTQTKPAAPTVHRYSKRHLNKLYWRWFLERWEQHDPSGSEWGIDSEQSGVWCSSWASKIAVPADKRLRIPGTGTSLPGPFNYSVHLEIWSRRSVLSPDGTKVGIMKVSVDKDRPEGKGRELYREVDEVSDELEEKQFKTPGRRPSSGTNFTVLRRPLRTGDLRYSKLTSLLKPWLQEDAIA